MNEWLTEEKLGLQFANDFLSEFLKHGFQSLNKKDLDLLIFYLMFKYEVIDSEQSNYELAKKLKITPSKLKTLLLESTLRWGTVNAEEIVKNVLNKFFEEDNLEKVIENEKVLIKEGIFPILIENPIEQLEFENYIKLKKGYPRVERNREIIRLHLDTFLEIVRDFMPDEKKIIRRLKDSKEIDTKDFFTKDMKKITSEEFRKVLNAIGYKLLSKATSEGLFKGLAYFGKVLLGGI